MRIAFKLTVLAIALLANPAVAQSGEANVMIIAQALDRCMATYAVRLTKTSLPDDQIYDEAMKGCAALNAKFLDGIKASAPTQQVAEILKEVEDSRKPNFLNMLAKIRIDRAKREGDQAGY